LKSNQKEILKTWLATGLWLGLIVTESTDAFSSEHTGRYLYPLFHFLFKMDLLHFKVLPHYLRKTGHFVGYFVLSLFLFGSWRATLRRPSEPRWALLWGGTAYFMATFVASMDEWHQTTLPSRTGTWHDVVLDSSAALTAQIVIFLFIRWRSRAAKSLS
jgi:VanZ family protein